MHIAGKILENSNKRLMNWKEGFFMKVQVKSSADSQYHTFFCLGLWKSSPGRCGCRLYLAYA